MFKVGDSELPDIKTLYELLRWNMPDSLPTKKNILRNTVALLYAVEGTPNDPVTMLCFISISDHVVREGSASGSLQRLVSMC
jgi:hypothetical protein